MTLEKLQEFLDREKWNESQKRRADMCGRYERCRYCMRFEEYPCARAQTRLLEMRNGQTPASAAAVPVEPAAIAPVEESVPVAPSQEVIRPQVITLTTDGKKEGIRVLSIVKKQQA